MFKYKIAIPDDDEDEVLDLLSSVVLGENIDRALLDSASPFSMLLDKAREEFLVATQSLIDPKKVDLFSPEGIKQARSLQAEAARYIDLCRWVMKTIAEGEEATEQSKSSGLLGEGEDAIDQLMDELNGRATPAPDA